MQKMWEMWVRSLDWEDPLEEGMATHSSILAYRILLENPMDRGAWQASVHTVANSWTWLKQLSMYTHTQNVVHQSLSKEFSRQEYWSGLPCHPQRDLPNPGIEPRSPTLQSDSLPAEAQGKPKHTEVGRLSLLQQIFLTQEWNLGLLHCRQILFF